MALNDNTGAATAVTIKWDSTNTWENNANVALGGSHKLMKNYLDSDGGAIAALSTASSVRTTTSRRCW